MRKHLRIDLRVGVLPAGQLVTAMPLRSFWFIGFTLLAAPWHSIARAQTIGNDGSASYTFPFPLPAARGRFQPSLALTYNSNAGVSAYGLGWNLNENYIEDETRATLTTSGTPRHRYILVRDGARHLLVQAADGTYRMDVGDGYFSIVQEPSGQWNAVDGVGTSFTYTPISTTSVRSYLTRVADVDQNVTTYEYQAESQRCPLSDWNLALLSKIQYNFTAPNGAGTAIHVVTLQYSPAAATQAEEAAGCLILHDEMLQRVDIARAQTAGGVLELGYWSVSYDISPDTGRPRLRQIQPLDRRGNPSGLNATSFAYESDQAGTTSVTPFAAGVPVSVPQSPYSTPSITECEDLTNIPLMKSCQVQDIAAWIDMDGDGLPDLAWGDGGGIRWARNITRPTAGIRAPAIQFAAPVLIPDGNWPGILTFINGGQQTQNFAIDSTTSSVMTTSLVLDVDGDGLPDLVAESALLSPAECPSGTISIRFAQRGATQPQYAAPVCAPATAAYNKFKTLYDATAQQLPLGYAIKSSGTSASKLLMADITGDGMQDIIIYDVGVWHAYRDIEMRVECGPSATPRSCSMPTLRRAIKFARRLVLGPSSI
ncbi:MAG TPA: SpvB/TcaC N-terminal domain-containing protein [Myxococcales bacterium]